MFLQDKSKQHKNVNAEKKQEGPEGRRKHPGNTESKEHWPSLKQTPVPVRVSVQLLNHEITSFSEHGGIITGLYRKPFALLSLGFIWKRRYLDI